MKRYDEPSSSADAALDNLDGLLSIQSLGHGSPKAMSMAAQSDFSVVNSPGSVGQHMPNMSMMSLNSPQQESMHGSSGVPSPLKGTTPRLSHPPLEPGQMVPVTSTPRTQSGLNRHQPLPQIGKMSPVQGEVPGAAYPSQFPFEMSGQSQAADGLYPASISQPYQSASSPNVAASGHSAGSMLMNGYSTSNDSAYGSSTMDTSMPMAVSGGKDHGGKHVAMNVNPQRQPSLNHGNYAAQAGGQQPLASVPEDQDLGYSSTEEYQIV